MSWPLYTPRRLLPLKREPHCSCLMVQSAQRATLAQNNSLALIFHSSCLPWKGQQPALRAKGLETVEYGFGGTDPSSERSFGNIPTHVRPHEHLSSNLLWEEGDLKESSKYTEWPASSPLPGAKPPFPPEWGCHNGHQVPHFALYIHLSYWENSHGAA